jgi:hypothetical protein
MHIQEELAEALLALEDRDAQLASYSDHVESLELRIKKVYTFYIWL